MRALELRGNAKTRSIRRTHVQYLDIAVFELCAYRGRQRHCSAAHLWPHAVPSGLCTLRDDPIHP